MKRGEGMWLAGCGVAVFGNVWEGLQGEEKKMEEKNGGR